MVASVKPCRLCGTDQYEPIKSRGRICDACSYVYLKQYRAGNKQHINEYRRSRYSTAKEVDPKTLWLNHRLASVKHKCVKHGIPFDLDFEYLKSLAVEACPALGIRLSYTNTSIKDDSASVDRLDPTKGYVRGNVAIIYTKANRCKNDASVDELQRVLDWMRSAQLE